MGLPAAAAALWTVGTLVLLSSSRTTAASQEDGDFTGPCLATLTPEGPCELDRDECPFVFNLPPMTVNLPRKLMELERLVEELQLLKDNVDELRKICTDCAVSQSERECGGGTGSEDGIWINRNPDTKNADKPMWERENNKKVLTEDGKSLVRDRVEQVAAAGKNVRITAGKKLDRKQIDGREKGVLDKLLKRVNNGSQSQNKTIGKTELLRDRVMDRKKQTGAEDGGEKKQFERGGWQDETVLCEKGENYDTKSDHQIPISSSKAEQEDLLEEERTQSRDKDNTDTSDQRIWTDKHHQVDYERSEKNYSNINKSTEEPIDSDGPDVWRDKSQVDKNQMHTGRYGEGIEERGKTRISNDKKKNTQSGHHVWRDETMESGSPERIKLSGEEGGDPSGERDRNKAKQAEWERSIKDTGKELTGERPAQKLREVENSGGMEGTDLGSLSQASVINYTTGNGFIDLDQAFTLTSPSPFTASHWTTDVKPGQRKSAQNNERGGRKEDSRTDTEFDDEDYKMSGEENLENIENDQMGRTVWHFSDIRSKDKVEISGRHKPTKTDATIILAATKAPYIASNSDVTTDSKEEHRKTNYGPTSQSNYNANSHFDEPQAKVEKQPRKTSTKQLDKNRDVDEGEQKSTFKLPSQTSHNDKNTATEHASSIDAQSAKNTSLGQRKTTSGPPSQRNQHEKDTNTMHSKKPPSQSHYNKMDTKTTQPITAKDSSTTKSRPIKEGNRKIAKGPSSQSHKDEKDSESSSLDTQSAKATSQTQTSVLAKETTTNSQVTTNLDKVNQKRAKGPSHSNIDEIHKDGLSLETRSAKATNQTKTSVLVEETSTFIPTNAQVATNLDKVNQKKDKGPSDQDEKNSEDLMSIATNHTTIALVEDVITSTPVFKSQFTPDDKKGHGKLTYEPKSQSNQDKKVIDDRRTTVLGEVTTSSTPTVNMKEQKSPYRPPDSYDERDSNFEQTYDPLLATVSSQQTGTAFMEDISTTTMQHRASFKDKINLTTYTPHQISPTTTSQPTTDNTMTARMNMSKKTTQDQGPKVGPKHKVGMKPTANQKLKNVKNDRKRDRTPPPYTGVKYHQRPVTHVKVTPGKAPRPVQIAKSDQSPHSHSFQVRVNETDNQLPQAVPGQKSPGQMPTSFPRLMDVNISNMMLTEEHQNASSVSDDRLSEADKQDKKGGILTNNERSGIFIKITEQNETSSAMLNQSNTFSFNGTKDRMPGQSIPKNPKLNPKVSKINEKTKQAQVPKVKPKMETGQITKVKPKQEHAPKARMPKPNQFADFTNSSKVSPGRKTQTKTLKPKAIPAPKTKPPLKPKSKEGTDMVPTSGPMKMMTEKATEVKSTISNPETAPDLQALHNKKVLEGSTLSTNSRITSDGGSQTTSQAPSIPLTTLANKDIYTTPPSNRDSSQQENVRATNRDKTMIPSSAPRVRSLFRSTTPGSKAPAAEDTTPSTRELRVKINQVAAFLNKSNTLPHGRGLDVGSTEHQEDKQTGRTDSKKIVNKPVNMVIRDCSDHMLTGHTKSGVYPVRPDPSGGTFHVFCELEVDGGGWTVLQRRQDGSVSFNRSWAEYREGFGQLDGGEFWLGNSHNHLLTRDRPMELRVDLEDFEGVQEYARYELFKVASERMRYRLLVDGYSGTAGNALRFNNRYDHNNRAFTTPDRDNDRYPSGNCGAYYSSGWWFDACMAANLNGRYYMGRYKGVRDGIYWGTWHNISSEYYPTNERQSFKTVRMMIRPQRFKP